jgi:hypothetical protein
MGTEECQTGSDPITDWRHDNALSGLSLTMPISPPRRRPLEGRLSTSATRAADNLDAAALGVTAVRAGAVRGAHMTLRTGMPLALACLTISVVPRRPGNATTRSGRPRSNMAWFSQRTGGAAVALPGGGERHDLDAMLDCLLAWSAPLVPPSIRTAIGSSLSTSSTRCRSA